VFFLKIEENIIKLLKAALQACFLSEGEIISVTELPMVGVGYSGATLHRYDIQYALAK